MITTLIMLTHTISTMLNGLRGRTYAERKQQLLVELDRFLAFESKQLVTYGFPAPPTTTSELELARDLQDSLNPDQEFIELMEKGNGLNAAQQAVFEAVQQAFSNDETLLIYVQVWMPIHT